MKQTVTVMGVLTGACEKEYILLVRSLRANGGFYKDSPVQLVRQGSCSEKAEQELSRLGVSIVDELVRPTTMFSVWLKPATIILKEPIFENLYDHEIAAHCKMADYELHWNHKTKADYVEHLYAQSYLKTLFLGKSKPDYYIQLDDWFVQIPTGSFAHRDWVGRELELKKLFLENYDRIEDSEFSTFTRTKRGIAVYASECASAISLSLLEMTRKYEFTEPKGTSYQFADNDTCVCYYGDWDMVHKITNSAWVKDHQKDIKRILR